MQLKHNRDFNDHLPFEVSYWKKNAEIVQAWQTVVWVSYTGWFWKNPLLSFIFHHLCLSFSICIPGIIKTAHWALFYRNSKQLWTFLSSLKERCYKKFKSGDFHARHWLYLHLNLNLNKIKCSILWWKTQSTINQ